MTESMFSGCTDLVSCKIPCQMRRISTSGFAYCSSLSSYTESPEFLESIGSYAFFNCVSLPKLTIGKNASMGNMPFFHCTGATSIDWGLSSENDFKPNCKMISSSAFTQCFSLSSTTFEGNVVNKVVIPSGITSIGDFAFRQCYSMT